MPLQIRRGTNAQRQILAVPLASGELLWTTDTQQLFIGDGATLANALTPVVGYNDENAQDAAGAIFTNGSHTDITFNYVDGSNTIDADVSISAFRQNVDMGVWSLSGSGDITTTGTITAESLVGNYKGSIFGDDSTNLVNAVDSSINLDGTVKGNIIPDTDLAYDIGSGSARFNDLYLSGSSIFLGDAVINSVGTAVNLPSGSTINGEPLGAATFAGTDLNVNIIGDDSSIIVDSSSGNINAATVTGTFVGTLDGDVTGSVFADDSTLLLDGIDNSLVAPRLRGNKRLISDGARAEFQLKFDNMGDLNESYGQIVFAGRTTAGLEGEGAKIVGGKFGVFVQNDFNTNSPGVYLESETATMTYQGIAFGTYFPSAELDIRGNAIISGTVEADAFTGDLTGSLYADTSTVVFDGTDSRLFVENINVIGETGNTPATPGAVDSWLEISVNGATKYIPLYA